jgi:hypothetical protein
MSLAPGSKHAADGRRLLEMLARAPDGLTETTLLASHRFTLETLVELITSGLVVAKPERVVGDGREINITRLHLTEAGRQTLSQQRCHATSASTFRRGRAS